MTRVLLSVAGSCLLLAAAPVLAQAPVAKGDPHVSTPSPGGPRGTVVTRPTWKELSPSQRDALAPLSSHWDTLDRDRKDKWLDVAAKYPRMSPEGQQRLHERMVEFVRLTPEQRNTARENFKKAYELPAEQRQNLLQQYQQLSPEKKQELADKAAAERAAKKDKTEPPRRPTRDLKPGETHTTPARAGETKSVAK